MKSKLVTILRRIIFSIGIIYGINIALRNVGIIIPFNLISIGTISILGVPGLLSIFAILYIIK